MADEEHTSLVVVALPAEGDSVQGIGPEQKHATLLFFGEPQTGDENFVRSIVEIAAREWAPFTEEVKALGPLGDEGAQVWFLDGEEGTLPKLRDDILDIDHELMSLLERVEQYPQYTPHVTIGYENDEETLTEDDLSGADSVQTITFDRLAVWSGPNQWEYPMTAQTEESAVEPDELEVPLRVPFHGILAPEGVRSGDGRRFLEGALSARELPLILDWQKISADGHSQAVPVGGIEKAARIGNMIHYSGHFFTTPEADEFIGLTSELGWWFVSIDAVDGKAEFNEAEECVDFSQGVIAGATACKVQAFEEAKLFLGEHPILDREDDLDQDEQGDGEEVEMLGIGVAQFKRGPGWVTHPRETKRIHDYWTKKGQPGYAKIAWGTSGDFRRCRVLVGEKIASNSPEDVRFLNQICAQWHHDALGYWPGEKGLPGNPKASDEDVHEFKVVSLAASAAVPYVPLSYFANPKFEAVTPMTITEPDEMGFRRVFGHFFEHEECHVGFLSQQGICVTPPLTKNDYASFLLGAVETDEGLIKVGTLVAGTGHANEYATWREAMAWYDNTGNAWASVNVGEDEWGGWYAGVVHPDITEEQLFKIRAIGQLSGDWRAIHSDEADELIGILAVNSPGYTKLRPTMGIKDGVQISLVAAAVVSSTFASEDPVEDLAAEVEKRIKARAERRERMKQIQERVK